jgi:peptide/nickel transport system permease protein
MSSPSDEVPALAAGSLSLQSRIGTRRLAAVAIRVASCLALLAAVSVLIFAGTQLLPGDVAQAILGQQATASALAAIRADLGFDRPTWIRYLGWAWGVLRGDLGVSWASGQPVAEALLPRLTNSLFLAGVTAAVAIPLSVSIGVTAAIFRDGVIDRVIMALARASVALPEFFVGYVLIYVFAVHFGWLDSSATVYPGMSLAERLTAIVLPAMTLVLAVTGHMATMTRAALLNVLSSPFVEMAELKGIPYGRIVVRHALPNALAPIISVIAINLAYLIVGVVVVEVIFVYPGMGQYLVDSVAKRDVPVVQAAGTIFAAVYITINALADLAVIVANPRTRLSR